MNREKEDSTKIVQREEIVRSWVIHTPEPVEVPEKEEEE